MGSIPLEDVQQKAWVGTCNRCGDGLNEYEDEPDEWGHTYCPACKEEMESWN